MNRPSLPSISALFLCAWFGRYSAPSHAEILINGLSEGNSAIIQNGDSILGSGPTDGVTVNDAEDQLSVVGGVIDIAGVGSIGIRVLEGSVTMSGGAVKGVEAGVLVQGGHFDFLGGSIRDGVKVQDAGSLFDMSGGSIRNRNVVASAGGAIAISGGLIDNSRVQAIGAASRVDVSGGQISWLDVVDGGTAHVYGTAFSINNTAVDFGGGDEFVAPPTAGFMHVTYSNQTTGSFKVLQSTGGAITLHLLPQGDFDADGDVDGADFLKWQRGELNNPLSTPDLAAWQANYGAAISLAPASAIVPEPSAWRILLVMAASLLCVVTRLPRMSIREHKRR